MLLFLIGCDAFSESKTEFYNSTESINLSEENISSIKIKSTTNDITGTFGKPVKVNIVTNPTSKHLIYEGIEFGIIDDKVFRYYFNNYYQTSKGITMSNTKEDVIQAYGKDFYERVESGLDTIGYFDKVNMINLEIGFKENKAVLITIEKVELPNNN